MTIKTKLQTRANTKSKFLQKQAEFALKIHMTRNWRYAVARVAPARVRATHPNAPARRAVAARPHARRRPHAERVRAMHTRAGRARPDIRRGPHPARARLFLRVGAALSTSGARPAALGRSAAAATGRSDGAGGAYGHTRRSGRHCVVRASQPMLWRRAAPAPAIRASSSWRWRASPRGCEHVAGRGMHCCSLDQPLVCWHAGAQSAAGDSESCSHIRGVPMPLALRGRCVWSPVHIVVEVISSSSVACDMCVERRPASPDRGQAGWP